MTARANISEAAGALGISSRRLRLLCQQGRVRGARLVESGRGPLWEVPVGADGLPTISAGKRGPDPRGLRG